MAFLRLPLIKPNLWQRFADVYTRMTRTNHIIHSTVESKRHFYFKFQAVKSEDGCCIILKLSSGRRSSTNTTFCCCVCGVDER